MKVTENFPCSSVGKESACNAGDQGSIPGLGRSPGEGNGNLLQYSCLENPMDRGAWRARAHGVAKELDMTEATKQQSQNKVEITLQSSAGFNYPYHISLPEVQIIGVD